MDWIRKLKEEKRVKLFCNKKDLCTCQVDYYRKPFYIFLFEGICDIGNKIGNNQNFNFGFCNVI